MNSLLKNMRKFHEAFGGRKNLEKGMLPIGLAIAFAGSAYLAVDTMKESFASNMKSQKAIASGLNLIDANSSALELTSQLIGNGIIIVDPTTKGFRIGAGTKDMITAKQLTFDSSSKKLSPSSGGSNGSWYFDDKNKLLMVRGCAKPTLDREFELYSQSTYQDDDNTWVKNSNLCLSDYKVVTAVKAVDYLAAGQVKSAQTWAHAEVEAVTKIDSGILLKNTNETKITKRARVALNDTTRKCDSANAEHCEVDHCKFMEPLLLSDGSVKYLPDGKPAIVPNGRYEDSMALTINPAAHGIDSNKKMEMQPTQLINFLNNSYGPGKINPFSSRFKWQGIEGQFDQPANLIQFTGPNTAVLNIPMTSSKSGSSSDALTFEGFLYKSMGPNQAGFSAGSSAIAWPTGTSYEDIAQNLKWGCQRTIGTSAPDLCARISLTYKRESYSYEKYRRCWYVVPENEPLSKTIDNWNIIEDYDMLTKSKWKYVKVELKKYVSQDCEKIKDKDDREQCEDDERDANDDVEIVASNEVNKEGVKLLADSRKLWLDDYPHDEYDTKTGVQQVKVAFSFPDIKIGSQEFAETQNIRTTKYWKYVRVRELTKNFDVRCEYHERDSNKTKNDLSICMYLTYNNIKDRKSCSRQMSSYVCRNSNGCFGEGTPIKMADGSIKSVEKIKIDDMVLNPVTGRATRVSNVTVGDQLKPMFKVTTRWSTVEVTENHPMVTDQGILRADKLTKKHKLLDEKGNYVDIERIEEIPVKAGRLVWNLVLDDLMTGKVSEHMMAASGIVTGDWYIQNLDDEWNKGDFQRFSEFLKQNQIKNTSH